MRDNLGRIAQRTEVIQGMTTTWGYSYDPAGRLQSVTRNGSAFESYTYDSNDNRLTKTATAGTTTYAVENQDRLLSAIGPAGAQSWLYDGNGDLLQRIDSSGQTTFDYDTTGQLLSVTKLGGQVVSYELDAGNKRAVKRVNGVVQHKWLYAGGLLPVAEYDANDNLLSVFNGGYMVKNGTTYRLLRDHLGSVRLVVDANTGTVAQRLSYGPFGEVLEDTNPGFQPFGYAGGLYDSDTGLVRFGARDYDPSIGRWTCKDPVGLEAGANVYVYCGQDPLNCIDLSGLGSISIGSMSDAEVARTQDMLFTMLSTPVGRDLYSALKNSDYDFEIVAVNGQLSPDHPAQLYVSESDFEVVNGKRRLKCGRVYQIGIDFTNLPQPGQYGPNKSMDYQTPVHEFGHGYQAVFHPDDYVQSGSMPDKSYKFRTSNGQVRNVLMKPREAYTIRNWELPFVNQVPGRKALTPIP